MEPSQSNLRTLAEASVVAFGGVGFAAQTLPETAAYFAVADELARHPERALAQVEPLLTTASPAGRIYAATLLAARPEVGPAAWRRLTGDHAGVQTMAGCIAGRTTVAEYAREQLAAG